MSRIDCGDNTAPCVCDCGHLSSSHVTYEKWLARCTAEGCICDRMDVCGCAVPLGERHESDDEVLAACGISAFRSAFVVRNPFE